MSVLRLSFRNQKLTLILSCGLAVFELSRRGPSISNSKVGGDGHGGDFRQKVWAMTGGPNCRPKHWKRNTTISMFGVFLACIPVAMLSAKLEQHPHMPMRPIPSQLWCKNFGNQEYENWE